MTIRIEKTEFERARRELDKRLHEEGPSSEHMCIPVRTVGDPVLWGGEAQGPIAGIATLRFACVLKDSSRFESRWSIQILDDIEIVP